MAEDVSPPSAVIRAWQLGGPRRPSADGVLSVAKVVGGAIELADDEGLPALSFRRLGQRLGSSSMALYRHVDSRDDLILLMFDVALGAPSEAIRDAPRWQDSVVLWATEISDRYRAHPWLLDAPLGGFPSTPNRALWLEYILQSLRPTGLGLQDMLDASLLVDGHARNSAYLDRELSRSSDLPPTALWLKDLLNPATFPMLSRVLVDGALDDESAVQEISFGLARIIGGIEQLISEGGDR
jgi:AcrR family transcriptional regulator